MVASNRQTGSIAVGAKSPEAFRTIAEVADELELPQHVLRFWETKFPQVQPLKRRGGRRYYRPEDVVLLRRIRGFLYNEGYTIRGVQKLLRSDNRSRAGNSSAAKSPAGASEVGPLAKKANVNSGTEVELRALLKDLEDIQSMLSSGRV